MYGTFRAVQLPTRGLPLSYQPRYILSYQPHAFCNQTLPPPSPPHHFALLRLMLYYLWYTWTYAAPLRSAAASRSTMHCIHALWRAAPRGKGWSGASRLIRCAGVPASSAAVSRSQSAVLYFIRCTSYQRLRLPSLCHKPSGPIIAAEPRRDRSGHRDAAHDT